MEPAVFALVACSAFLHVAWNVVLKTARDPLRAASIGMAAASLVVAPIALAAWWLAGRPVVPAEAWLVAGTSGVVEAVYFVLLAAAYQRGDLSVVYPIARGSAPVFAVLLGTVLLGEHLGSWGIVGVVLLIAGLLWLQRPWRVLVALRAPAARGPGRRAAIAGSAIPFALATGVAIACYSALDRVGVRLVEPIVYAGLIWPVGAAALGVVLVVRRRVAPDWAVSPDPTRSAGSGRAAAGGLMTLATYFLILNALRIAPLSAVAPLRESAVVLASGWGAFGMREAQTRRIGLERVGASVLVVSGAVLLALGS